MLKKDYTAKLLNLEDVIITKVENISEEVHVYLELPRVKHRCPACGALTDRVHDYRMQIIKDIPLGRTTLLHLRKRRYRCDCGKRFLEKNTFISIFLTLLVVREFFRVSVRVNFSPAIASITLLEIKTTGSAVGVST